MVLTEESEPQVGHEFWDALALKAIEVLVEECATTFARTLSEQNDDYIQYAKLRRGDEVFLLIRSQAEPPLGLLFICERRTQTETLAQTAREELESLASTN